MKKDTQIRRLRPGCLQCLLNKYMEKCPADIPEETKLKYMQMVFAELSAAEWDIGGPVLIDRINRKMFEMFWFCEDYTEIKLYFNELMMKREKELNQELAEAEDKLRLAIQYALTGNYIDFGALDSVEEEKLTQLLADAKQISFDEGEYRALCADLANAKYLVYLPDNCGEIVMDKLLIELLQKLYPECEITVIVRGSAVLNDVTMEDAVQVGLTEQVRVIGNGNGIAGTWLAEASEEAREAMDTADVIIAKGQANFETLRLCGRNIYYLFLCKCEMFAKSFGVPRLTGMLINDRQCK